MIKAYYCKYFGFDKNAFVFTAPNNHKFRLYAPDISPLMTETQIAKHLAERSTEEFIIGVYCVGDGYYVQRKRLAMGEEGYGVYNNSDNSFTGNEYYMTDLIPKKINGVSILKMRVTLLGMKNATAALV